MRAVPRHVFVPDAPLETAYGLDPVVTYRDGKGIAISSASAPGVLGGMLEQLEVRPGQRVLEVGAGTGYNAALLARLVGPAGAVATVEYDEGVTQAALAVGSLVAVVRGTLAHRPNLPTGLVQPHPLPLPGDRQAEPGELR